MPDGCVQLADLATTGTASSSTFLRGDAAFAEAGGGKVLKHYYNHYDVSTSMGGASTYSMYGGLVGTFTPSAAGSSLLVMMVQAGQHIITSDPDVSMKYTVKVTIGSGSESDLFSLNYVADRATSNARHFHHIPLIKTAKINACSSIQKGIAFLFKYKTK